MTKYLLSQHEGCQNGSFFGQGEEEVSTLMCLQHPGHMCTTLYGFWRWRKRKEQWNKDLTLSRNAELHAGYEMSIDNISRIT